MKIVANIMGLVLNLIWILGIWLPGIPVVSIGFYFVPFGGTKISKCKYLKYCDKGEMTLDLDVRIPPKEIKICHTSYIDISKPESK